MSKAKADIVGTTGANFTFTIDSGKIVLAFMADNALPPLTVGGNDREVTIPKLAAGDSLVVLAMIWRPDEPDATIDVGSIVSGKVSAASPKHTIDSGKNPGYVKLFGE
jgi:hypothetical protein